MADGKSCSAFPLYKVKGFCQEVGLLCIEMMLSYGLIDSDILNIETRVCVVKL